MISPSSDGKPRIGADPAMDLMFASEKNYSEMQYQRNINDREEEDEIDKNFNEICQQGFNLENRILTQFSRIETNKSSYIRNI